MRKGQSSLNSVIITAVIILFVAGGYYVWRKNTSFNWNQTVPPSPTSTTNGVSTSTLEIVVAEPQPNQKVKSPIVLSGEARGTWYFEASFPVILQDSSGKVLAQVPAQAQSDWMTTSFVPFSAKLSFIKPVYATSGVLIFKNDNPSGDPSRDKEVRVPVRF